MFNGNGLSPERSDSPNSTVSTATSAGTITPPSGTVSLLNIEHIVNRHNVLSSYRKNKYRVYFKALKATAVNKVYTK